MSRRKKKREIQTRVLQVICDVHRRLLLNVRLPLLLLLITASYRCHPQTLPHVLRSAATARPACGTRRGWEPWVPLRRRYESDRAHAPGPANGGVRQSQPGPTARRGPQHRAPHPTPPGRNQSSLYGSGSSHRFWRRYGTPAAAVPGTSVVPSPSFAFKTFLPF